jgi:hypothetical protein
VEFDRLKLKLHMGKWIFGPINLVSKPLPKETHQRDKMSPVVLCSMKCTSGPSGSLHSYGKETPSSSVFNFENAGRRGTEQWPEQSPLAREPENPLLEQQRSSTCGSVNAVPLRHGLACAPTLSLATDGQADFRSRVPCLSARTGCRSLQMGRSIPFLSLGSRGHGRRRQTERRTHATRPSDSQSVLDSLSRAPAPSRRAASSIAGRRRYLYMERARKRLSVRRPDSSNPCVTVVC